MPFLNSRKTVLTVIISVFLAGVAWATPVADNYIGRGDASDRDVIGNQSQFDIHGADIKRVGNDLLVRIHTNFAGLADNGLYSGFTRDGMGIGYGDLFLAPVWTPSGPEPYLADDIASGTTWTHAFSLMDDRWSDAGGAGFLYELDPQAKAAEILASDYYINGASYRNRQEVAIVGNPQSLLSIGKWDVTDASFIEFAIDISKADTLLASDQVAFHWTMTCGNDVIEGQAPNSVPEPSSILLMGMGIISIAGIRRCKLRKTD